MEEDVLTRYVFIMMLAIADMRGYVIGTDVAIARRLNIPTEEFTSSVDLLMQPDEDSNSMEEEGRRVILSDGERGYRIVNYIKYRDTRTEEDRRTYMKEYMRKRRSENDVAARKPRKHLLTPLTHADADTDPSANADTKPPKSPKGEVDKGFEAFWAEYPRKVAKEAARKAFGKVDVPLEVLLAALAWQKRSPDWIKEAGQFVPHASTWLNQRRWEDEPKLNGHPVSAARQAATDGRLYPGPQKGNIVRPPEELDFKP